MKKGKQLVSWLPEILLILETMFYWLSSTPLNPLAMILLAILVSVLISKNATLAVVTSILFLLLNAYMCLALISELSEFHSWSYNALLMLFVGGTMLGTGVIASASMFKKWKRQPYSIVQQIIS